jgi:hypothetical protein
MTIRESLKTKWNALPRGVHFLAVVITLVAIAVFLMFVVPRLWNTWTKPTTGIDQDDAGADQGSRKEQGCGGCRVR